MLDPVDPPRSGAAVKALPAQAATKSPAGAAMAMQAAADRTRSNQDPYEQNALHSTGPTYYTDVALTRVSPVAAGRLRAADRVRVATAR
jgi:hypothetical protein